MISAIDKVNNRISDIMSRIDNIQKKHNPLLSQIKPKDGTTTNSDSDPILNSNQNKKVSKPLFKNHLEALINNESKNQSVNPDLIRAIIKTESNGNPSAISKAGAIGLMQLMPNTAKSLGVNPHNPAENIRGGVTYLKKMANKFGDFDKTLAAYNAGPGAVNKYGGVPPFKETQDYIKRIKTILNQ